MALNILDISYKAKMYIYKVTNNINGKKYVGLTTQSIHTRFSQHMCASRSGNSPIHNAMRKYGVDNFKISELDTAKDIDELCKKERFWVKELNSLAPNGYNLKEGGQIGGNGGANKGIKWNKKAKEKHSVAMKNRDIIPWNKDTKGLCKANKGSFTSESTVGELNNFYGKTHSEEARLKIIEANKKRKGVARKKVTCPYCNKIGGSNLMQRYHFDNCKYKVIGG